MTGQIIVSAVAGLFLAHEPTPAPAAHCELSPWTQSLRRHDRPRPRSIPSCLHLVRGGGMNTVAVRQSGLERSQSAADRGGNDGCGDHGAADNRRQKHHVACGRGVG